MKVGDSVWYYEAGNAPVMASVVVTRDVSRLVDIAWDDGESVQRREMVQVRDPDHSYCVPVDLNDRDEYVPRETRADGSALPVRTSTQEHP